MKGYFVEVKVDVSVKMWVNNKGIFWVSYWSFKFNEKLLMVWIRFDNRICICIFSCVNNMVRLICYYFFLKNIFFYNIKGVIFLWWIYYLFMGKVKYLEFIYYCFMVNGNMKFWFGSDSFFVIGYVFYWDNSCKNCWYCIRIVN